MKTEWKILCSSHKACPEIIKEMDEKLNFIKIKDTPKTPTSDISAILECDNDQEINEKAETLLKNYRGRIQRITISH